MYPRAPNTCKYGMIPCAHMETAYLHSFSIQRTGHCKNVVILAFPLGCSWGSWFFDPRLSFLIRPPHSLTRLTHSLNHTTPSTYSTHSALSAHSPHSNPLFESLSRLTHSTLSLDSLPRLPRLPRLARLTRSTHSATHSLTYSATRLPRLNRFPQPNRSLD